MSDKTRKNVRQHTGLVVYQKSFRAAMRVFELSNAFPNEERYSLTDQIRRSSRSVSTNLVEGWRKRRYEAAMVAKFADSEGEAAETQCWLQFSVECKYLSRDVAANLYKEYDEIIRILVHMINHPKDWLL